MQQLTKEEFQSLIEGMTEDQIIDIMPGSIDQDKHGNGGYILRFGIYNGIFTIYYGSKLEQERRQWNRILFRSLLPRHAIIKMILRLFEENYLSEYKIK